MVVHPVLALSYDVCKNGNFTVFCKWNTVACMFHYLRIEVHFFVCIGK